MKAQDKFHQAGFSVVEVLISFAVILMIALAGFAMIKQVYEINKRSRVVSLAIQLEGALLEAFNGSHRSFSPAIQTRLRNGQPPEVLTVFSSFGVQQGADTNESLQRVEPLLDIAFQDNVSPVYFDVQGQRRSEFNSDSPWALRVFAALRHLNPGSTQSLPLYALAYSIETNERFGGVARSFGQRTNGGSFTAEDFIFPMNLKSYTLQAGISETTGGSCVESTAMDQVISLQSLNLRTRQSFCILKGNQCQPGQFSQQVQFNYNPQGHSTIDLVCRSFRSCGCVGIGPRPGFHWAVTSVNPQMLMSDSGGSCGTCGWAYKSPVDARPKDDLNPSDLVYESEICPKYYSVGGSVQCVNNVVIEPRSEFDFRPPEDSDGDGVVDDPGGVCFGVAPPMVSIQRSMSGSRIRCTATYTSIDPNECWMVKYPGGLANLSQQCTSDFSTAPASFIGGGG